MTRGAKIEVLLVEDNPGDARLVEIMLSETGSSAGFEVAHAESLDEALGRLAEASFDVILLDLSLPDSSGLETVSRMRTAAPRTPMVVFSGQHDEEVALQAVQRGAQDYLIKGQGDGDLIARTIRYSIERQQAEEELRESEERFRLLVEGVEDYAIFMLDPEGRVASWNEGAERIEGYATEEICGEHFSLFFTEEEVQRGDPEEELQIAATASRFQKEGLRVRKDGSRFWADVVITALRDDAGNLRGFSKLIRDITGRKEAEETLRRSLKEMGDLKFALDESAIVATADAKGTITYVNDKFCEISGYSRQELLDGRRRLADPGHHPTEVVEDLWRTIGQGLVWRGEIGERARDATIYWLEMTVVPFLDELGKPHRYVAVCHDITDRKEAEGALKKSEEEFRALIQNASDLITVLEEDGTIRYDSPAIERILGYEPEERVGTSAFGYMHPEDVEWVRRTFAEIVRASGVRPPPVEFRLRHKDGSWRYLEVTRTNLLDDPNVRGVVANGRDITGRKEAEETLRRSLKEMGDLKFALDESAIVATADAKGTITYVNDKFCEISGYSRQELLGQDHHIIDPGYQPEELIDELWRTVAGGKVWRGEIEDRTKDGTRYWMDTTIVPFLDEWGEPYRYVAISYDITARKEAEGALKKSEERFRALIQNASDIIVVLDAGGTIVYESPTVERILGFKPEERVGTNILDHVDPNDVGWVRDKLMDIGEQMQERASMWYRVRDKEGSWHHFEVIATNLLHDPTVEGIVLNVRDITERRRAEEALRDSEAGYRTLVEQMPATTYIEAIDHDDRSTNLLYVSPQIEDMFGYSPDEWMSDPNLFPKLLHPEDRERALAEDARTDETGESFKVEYRQFTKDGRVVWIRDEAVLMRDEEGNPLFWQGVMHDITDQKLAEERLRNTLGSLLALHEAGQILGSTLERAEIGSWLLEIMERTSGLEAAVIDLNGDQLGPWRTTGPEYLWREARSAPQAQAARREVLEAAERRVFRLQKPGDRDGIPLVGLYLPLLVRERLIGILEVYGPEAVAEEHNVETITSLAGQAASALENARLYEEGAERERRLRELVGRVMVTQEEERRRVAYEVHDGLAQTAAAAHHLLQAFARSYPVDSAEGRIILDRALDLVQQTVGEARDVISDLRPTALDDFGLALAVRQQIEKLSGEGRRIEYEEALGDERLPNAVETTLYRVAQEALMNVHKHASSARARVTLQRLDGSVCLRVRDWGQGFRFEEVTTGDGPGERVGLSSMRERVALLGGSFEIHSEPGAGTEVLAEIPLPEDSA